MTRRCPHCWFTGIEETCRTSDRSWYHCHGCGLRWSDIAPEPGHFVNPHPRVTEARPRPAVHGAPQGR